MSNKILFMYNKAIFNRKISVESNATKVLGELCKEGNFPRSSWGELMKKVHKGIWGEIR